MSRIDPFPAEGRNGLPGRIVNRVRRDVPLALFDALVVVPAYLIPLALRFNGAIPSDRLARVLVPPAGIDRDPPLVQLPVRSLRPDVALRQRAGGAARRVVGHHQPGTGPDARDGSSADVGARSRSPSSCSGARRR